MSSPEKTLVFERAQTFRGCPRLQWSSDHIWGTWLWWEFYWFWGS